MTLAAFLPTAMQIGGGLMQHAASQKQAQAMAQPTRAERNMAMVSKAALDPSSPMYRRLVEQGAGERQRGFLGNLEDMVRRNRRLGVMGRQQLFDPERIDEQMYRGAFKNIDRSREAARKDTLGRLQKAFTQQSDLMIPQYDRKSRTGGPQSALGGIFKQLGGAAEDRGWFNPKSSENILGAGGGGSTSSAPTQTYATQGGVSGMGPTTIRYQDYDPGWWRANQ
jgi:hypothetical protein